VEPLNAEILEELRQGRASREEKLAVCTGGVKLPAPDMAEILSILALDSDELVSTRAQESILALPIENFVEALNRQQALRHYWKLSPGNFCFRSARPQRRGFAARSLRRKIEKWLQSLLPV